MKKLLVFLMVVLFSGAALAEPLDHREQRRIIQWGWPGRLVEMTEAWDGVEDRQAYLGRVVTWNGAPGPV